MIRWHQITAAWNRFFFEPESPLPIAVYRILLGLCALANQLLILPDVIAWWGERGSLSFSTARHVSGGTGFNLFNWLPHSNTMVWLLFWASCVLAFTLCIGLFTRASAVLLFLTLVTLNHRNTVVLNSGDTFLRIGTFFVIFSQAGAAFSVDRWLRLKRGQESGPPKAAAPWAMRLIQIQLSLLYLYAFAWKAMGAMWVSGVALYYTARLAEFWRFPVPYLLEHMWTIKLATWGTLLVEFAMGPLVWIKELRYWVLAAAVLLHLGIDYSMNIPLFGFIMMSGYVTFVDPNDLERLWAKFGRRSAPKVGASAPAPALSR